MDQVDPFQCSRWRPRQQLGRITGEQPDVADVVDLNLRQYLRHAVDVRLAADEAGIRKGARFRDQMFAAAESDFEPYVIGGIEQSGKVGRAGSSDIQCQARQQMFDQIGLMRPQPVAFASSEERAMWVKRPMFRQHAPPRGIVTSGHHRNV